MNLPDSFYIALCMTVLLVGAIYWVWTQIQFVQRKVNMLENIVYELKTLCSKPPPEAFLPSASAGVCMVAPTNSYPSAPASVLGEDEDLLHETLVGEVDAAVLIDHSEEVQHQEQAASDLTFGMQEQQQQEPEIPLMFQASTDLSKDVVADDLQPGGVGSGVIGGPSALDSMSLKELRRLAQQRGISGSSDMRKKDLIVAIKALPVDPLSFDA